jgi:uncharacterized protein (TIGR02147 family)
MLIKIRHHSLSTTQGYETEAVAAQKSIYDYDDYKAYLTDHIVARPKGGRGERAKLARLLRCDSAYVTQVLSGKAHFSLEQAQKIADYACLGDAEGHCFLLLVQRQRAGNDNLRRYFSQHLEALRANRRSLAQRLTYQRILPISQQAIYYSAWYYPAVHILLTVAEYRDVPSIQRYLGLPAAKVKNVLDFLVESGIAREQDGVFVPGDTVLHLDSDSPLSTRSHANWRCRVLESLDSPQLHDFHYSSVVSMTPADAKTIREMMVQAIEKIRGVVRKADERELYCYAMDLFTLRRADVS